MLDLKDFNEVNFARFDAKLEAFGSRFDAKLDAFRSEFDAKFDALESRFDAKLDAFRSEFDAKLEKRIGEQTRFFFLAWAILLASNIALWFR